MKLKDVRIRVLYNKNWDTDNPATLAWSKPFYLWDISDDAISYFGVYIPIDEEMEFEIEYMGEWIKMPEPRPGAFAPTRYRIWSAGFVDQGGSSDIRLLGEASGKDFKDACDNLALEEPDRFGKFYDKETMKWWGCRLFESNFDAYNWWHKEAK